MPDDKMLSQEEIDALLNQGTEDQSEEGAEEKQTEQEPVDAGEQSGSLDEESPKRIIESEMVTTANGHLTEEEKDAIGEVGNISMGSASTTLSELLGQRVSITSPKVRSISQKELFNAFQVPYMVIKVQFSEGLSGFNILIMQLPDAMVMANLMMGGDGTGIEAQDVEQISEMEQSAASEAMNQMIGTASTSLATMFNRDINIQPPGSQIVNASEEISFELPVEDPIVVVSFRLIIGELVDTEIMQVMSIETAHSVASLMWESIYGAAEDDTSQTGDAPEAQEEIAREAIESFAEEQEPLQQEEEPPPPRRGQRGKNGSSGQPQVDIDPQRLNMIMDIPLEVEVVLGRARKPIKEVQGYTPGAILELSSEVEEPVEVLVNGILVARGEVVVVNENFGIKITEILSPAERVKRLTE